MLEPSEYKKIYMNMSIEELIDKKNSLITSIKEYEDNYITGNKKVNNDINPSLPVRYKYQNLYLKEIIDIILTKKY